MPCYECICEKCGKESEVITLRISEPMPKCGCGGDLKKLPSTFTFRWAFREGVWERNDKGEEVFMGKGGPQRIVGGEKLNVHDDLPSVSVDPNPEIKDPFENEDVLEEVNESDIPEGVEH